MAQRKRKGKRGGKGDPEKRVMAAPRSRASAPRASAGKGDPAPRLVVGLGASAGGLDAFKAFFAQMPARSGMAFVLIQHLDPHHESLLVELLAKHTDMPVAQARDGTPVAADHVFVIPPNAVLTIEGGVLRVTTPAPPREQRRPIDAFFASLAADQQESAVCIILAGSGSDGSLGLQAVKEHGGIALAQAGFDQTALLGMPSSAAATGLVDEVLPVERMPARLLAYAQHLAGIGDRKAPDGTRLDAAEHLTKICALLRVRLGHDFRDYKEKTLIRRVQRRMQVLQIDSVPDYIERLRHDPEQLDLLFRDLLIGVTQFFRDPEAFAALESVVMPKLFENRSGDGPVRIWVPGCATGEEAYSIAMLAREAALRRDDAPVVQVFATDLDERAVAAARHARYRKPLSGVPWERIERWFADEGDDYCVVKNIREMCIYSIHNLVKDPPFSKLDLISCRNLLIYLDAPLQDRLARLFHYALRPGGYLFLGASEGISRHGGLFAMLDKKHRLFQRRDDVTASLPGGALAAPAYPGVPAATRAPPAGDDLDRRARQALEKYAPAFVVVNRQHEVLRFAGRTGPYIEHPPGAATLNLFAILRKDLLPAVRIAVQKTFATRQTVQGEELAVAVDGQRRMVSLVVEPVADEAGAELCVVAFQDRGPAGRQGVPGEGSATPDARSQALERELRATRAQLQSTIDDLEAMNEEMKSANEEYQSVNEEFQSANEELEGSKEELQSLNEELHTINAELGSKNEALVDANSNIKNLLDSTQIATLFLDGDLRIKNFTPTVAEVFHLRAGDRGRPITDIVTRLTYPDLVRDAKKAMRDLSVIEHEVATPEGIVFVMRVRPFRRIDDVIDGVVLTFFDVTERKGYEAERARLAAIVDSTRDAVIGHSFEGVITSWNRGAEEIFGYPSAEAIGQPLAMLLPPDRHDEVPRILEKLARGERIEHFEIGRTAKSGATIDVSMTISPVRNESGTMIGASTIARDTSERRKADNLRALMVDELNHRVKNTLATVQSIAAQTLKGVGADAAREVFDARLVALSQAHDLLARQSWEGASLRDLLLHELAPYGSKNGTRAVLEGPDVALRPKPALALAMAFHELATNAAKYGALSTPAGRIRVAWSVRSSATPKLRLDWAESGGPPVAKPARKGFGSAMIERGLSLDLDGTVRLDFEPGGVVCTIEIPLPAPGGKEND